MLATSLIEEGQQLIEKGVHPSQVIDGFLMAEEEAERLLPDLSMAIDPRSRNDLLRVASSCIKTKVLTSDSVHLAEMIVDTTLQIVEETRFGLTMDLENVKVVNRFGGSLAESQLINGIGIERDPASHTMPRTIDEARVALISRPLQIKRSIGSPELRISAPRQMEIFKRTERQILIDWVDRILDAGANVVIGERGMDDRVQLRLGERGALGVRMTYESEIRNLASATGAKIVGDIDAITAADLGYAKRVYVKKMENENWIIFDGCMNPKAIMLLLRGGSDGVVEEAGRIVHDALMVMKDVLEVPSVVVGGGAFEEELAQRLIPWARGIPDLPR